MTSRLKAAGLGHACFHMNIHTSASLYLLHILTMYPTYPQRLAVHVKTYMTRSSNSNRRNRSFDTILIGNISLDMTFSTG